MSDGSNQRKDDLSLIGSRTLQRETKAVLDRVQNDGEPVVIFRNGVPAAALVPIDEEKAKEFVLATSPLVRSRREPSKAEAPPEVFAVSEAEITEGEEPAAADSGEEALAILDETNRYLRIAAEGLASSDIAAIRERVAATTSEPMVTLDPAFAETQRRTARALVYLVSGLREQVETLDALTGQGAAEEAAPPSEPSDEQVAGH